MSRPNRLFDVLQRLRGADQPITADDLATRLGVSTRTLYRDIDTLRQAGAVIEGSPGVGYRLTSLPEGFATPAPEPEDPAEDAPGLLGLAPEPAAVTAARTQMRAAYRADEPETVQALAREARFDGDAPRRIDAEASRLVTAVRQNRRNEGGIDLFMHEYQLSSAEGVALMCLAEALLRIPDADTADALIEDKIGGANWQAHLGHADSLFVNASTLALMVSGRVLHAGEEQGLMGVLGRLVQRTGEPVIRTAVRQAMRILGGQFVMGRTIEEALKRAPADWARGDRHSFDMLGEAAYTMADAERYAAAYAHAIKAVGRASKGRGPIEAPGISVKLSALHPRYAFAQADRVERELYDRLLHLAEIAKAADIGFCVDAEEADRLDLSLDIIARLIREPSLAGWQGLGLAVQAYQKRARPLIDWLAAEARATQRRLLVRLVKGAYWDTEIKRAQELGVRGLPVLTRKAHTDVSYIACARAMLAADDAFYPCFATHNAHTVAAITEMAGNRRDLEFQRLYGMGEPLYDGVKAGPRGDLACRIYAPVGPHRDLLAYLVRRLLENGANSSFVNRIVDDTLPVAEIIKDPVREAEVNGFSPNPAIADPTAVFAPRVNSRGHDLTDRPALAALEAAISPLDDAQTAAGPLMAATGPDAADTDGVGHNRYSPADHGRIIGTVREATAADARRALEIAAAAQPGWDRLPAARRAEFLERAAELYEQNGAALMRLAVREAGKTWNDAVAELREAVDFLRYYAAETRVRFGEPVLLPGPTGERNTLRLAGRGVWLAISPWNFPLAIFTGQIAAALGAGNAVLAKPAEQTPLIAYEAVRLLHRAGVPAEVLALLPGDGPTLGGALIPDPRVAGVVFTGSTEVAGLINRQLAERPGPIAPLIAETGGINAMIVDSSALPEQVTRDVLASAFQSAGQRCSALRVLYVQQDVAERQIEMIAGAMRELRLGDPMRLASDVGPVIDAHARDGLQAHIEAWRKKGAVTAEAPHPADLPDGTWVAPTMIRVPGIGALERETFGPILHVATFDGERLDQVLADIAAAGYGLTLSIHSRIESKCRRIAERAPVGNIYINRNQIGAIVGSQPFGGEGLSGTGPKAGGPHYLPRFAVERTVSADLTAQGGNAQLLSLNS